MNPRSKRKDDAVGTPIEVRVTQEPGVVREVDEVEFIDLSRQGLIHSHNREGVKSPKKWVPKKRGEEVVEQTADIASTETKEVKK